MFPSRPELCKRTGEGIANQKYCRVHSSKLESAGTVLTARAESKNIAKHGGTRATENYILESRISLACEHFNKRAAFEGMVKKCYC